MVGLPRFTDDGVLPVGDHVLTVEQLLVSPLVLGRQSTHVGRGIRISDMPRARVPNGNSPCGTNTGSNFFRMLVSSPASWTSSDTN